MALKYEAELNARPDQPCPCLEQFKARQRVVFRFLHNTATEDDFVPKPGEVTAKTKCKAFGLSFWETLEKAQAKWRSLAETHDDNGATAVERYGDHIGQIELLPTDGVMDDPAKTGHITLHQEAGALFAARVTVYTRCEYLEECERNAS